MKIPDQRTAIRFKLVGNQGGGIYLSQATTTDDAIDWLRKFYAGRLASVALMQPESMLSDQCGQPPQPAMPEPAFGA